MLEKTGLKQLVKMEEAAITAENFMTFFIFFEINMIFSISYKIRSGIVQKLILAQTDLQNRFLLQEDSFLKDQQNSFL